MNEDRIFGELYSNNLAQKDFIELKDPFYNPHVVSALMTVMRHVGWSASHSTNKGLKIMLRFRKDIFDKDLS
jgi:hypothetical protein